jgi:hypothetical protein
MYNLPEKQRKIAGSFKSPCSAKEHLVAMNMMLQMHVHKLVPETATTWDITYGTLARLLLQEKCTAPALAAVDYEIEMLSSAECFRV